MAGRCVCKLGHVNISSNCVPLTSLTLLTVDPAKTVKGSTVCPNNQIYSSVLAQCTCVEGQKIDANGRCVSVCGGNEVYSTVKKECECVSGYTKIEGVCVGCKVSGAYSGN